jgi:hypothetical protein
VVPAYWLAGGALEQPPPKAAARSAGSMKDFIDLKMT